MVEILFALPVLAGVAAGLTWSLLGIWSKYKSSGFEGIDISKLKKNIVVGAGTGVATWVYSTLAGDITPVITSVTTFILVAGSYFPLVVVVDKLLTRKEE